MYLINSSLHRITDHDGYHKHEYVILFNISSLVSTGHMHYILTETLTINNNNLFLIFLVDLTPNPECNEFTPLKKQAITFPPPSLSLWGGIYRP